MLKKCWSSGGEGEEGEGEKGREAGGEEGEGVAIGS